MKPQKLPKNEFDYIYQKVPRLCVDLAVKTPGGLVLTKRKIIPYKGMWHTPGGTVLKGETLEEAVRRVALDEIGVKVKIKKMLGAAQALRDGNTNRHTVTLFFLVTPDSLDFQTNEQADTIQIFSSLPANMIPFLRKFLIENLNQ